jgi:hypothetical protein
MYYHKFISFLPFPIFHLYSNRIIISHPLLLSPNFLILPNTLCVCGSKHAFKNSSKYVRFEVFMAVSMKNAVFWDVTSCGSCKNRCFGGTESHHHQGYMNRELATTLNLTSNRNTMWFLHSVRRLLVTSNIVPISPILVTKMMETLRSSETSVLTKATRPDIPENGILHCHPREHLKSYIALTGWAL